MEQREVNTSLMTEKQHSWGSALRDLVFMARLSRQIKHVQRADAAAARAHQRLNRTRARVAQVIGA